jgi:hypothetical protein
VNRLINFIIYFETSGLFSSAKIEAIYENYNNQTTVYGTNNNNTIMTEDKNGKKSSSNYTYYGENGYIITAIPNK